MSNYPYPGLRPFKREETDIFFGRETQTDALLDRLAANHFLAVVGLSGCGKSSLVKTGMLPGLEGGLLCQAGVRWKVADLRPGHQPYEALAQSLMADDVLGNRYREFIADKDEATAFMQATLRRGPFGLHELLEECALPEGHNLLILVDQFEELFRFHRQISSEESLAFVALLLEACKLKNVYVVITMRSDFLGDCALYPGLPEAINDGIFLTPRLKREQLRDAIEGPAAVFGTHIEPTVVNRLLNDAGSDPDQLPLLQHALMRMWRASHTNDVDKTITMECYKEVGGLKKALSKHADKAYNELNDAQKRIAELMFRSLCETEADGRNTRRPMSLQQLTTLTQCDEAELIKVIDVFRKSGRSFLMPPIGVELTKDSIIDISHESLIRQWSMLQTWVNKEAKDADMYRRIENAALQWKAEGGGGKWKGLKHPSTSMLWSGRALEGASSWKKQLRPNELWASLYGREAIPGESAPYFELAMDFINACEQKQLTIARNKNKKELYIALPVILFIISIFIAYRFGDIAEGFIVAVLAIATGGAILWYFFRVLLAVYRLVFKYRISKTAVET